MTFAHPILAAVGAACVAVPILVHLLMRRRRRPVMWAAMRFVLQAVRQQRRRLRLEQFLLLAARCLLIVLVAAAVARPMLGSSVFSGRAAVTLYLLIDDSLTASAREGGPTSLERHKAAAEELLKQLDPAAGDRAGLVSLSSPARAVVVPASPGVSAVTELVREMEPTDAAADFPGAIATLAGVPATPSGGRTVIAVLSDFLTGSADTDRALGQLPASLGPVTILAPEPAPRGLDNVTITALDPLRPLVVTGADAATQAPVRVSMRRTGPGIGAAAAGLISLRVTTPGEAAPRAAGQATVRWAPGQSVADAPVDLALPAGAGGSLVLTATIDEDAVAGDNTFRRVVESRQSLRIGLVAPRPIRGSTVGVQKFEPADWFRTALDPTGAALLGREREIEVVDIDPASVDAARLSGLDAVIIIRPDSLGDAAWKQVRAMTDSGGLVVVAPPEGVTVHLWGDAMKQALGLDWTIARESRKLAEPATLRDESQRTASWRGPPDLLAVLAPELGELVKPVRVLQLLPVEAAAGSTTTAVLLALADGTPLLLSSPPGVEGDEPGRGLVVMLAAPPSFEWMDLQARALMVPLVQEIARMGIARARGSWDAVAGTAPTMPARVRELRLASGENRAPLASGQPVRTAGVLEAVDERGGVRGLVTVNADSAAGRTDPQPATGITNWLAASGATVQPLSPEAARGEPGDGTLRGTLAPGDEGAGWSLGLLIAALGVAVAELAMARWFSHASAARDSGVGA